MAPRHGITVYPGNSIDFSALARPESKTSHLLRRATTNAGGIVFLIFLVIIAIGLIAMGVVLILICKNKRQRRKRQQHMQATAPPSKHKYLVLEDMDSGHGGISELPQENQIGDPIPLRKVELPSDANEVPRVQQLDGFVAAPKPSAQPVELPSYAR